MIKKRLSIRLAFRVEGMWWVCYAAQANTMQGGLEMARVAMGIVEHPERKEAFMDIMKDALADFLEDKLGQRPDMIEQPAPESERSGNA